MESSEEDEEEYDGFRVFQLIHRPEFSSSVCFLVDELQCEWLSLFPRRSFRHRLWGDFIGLPVYSVALVLAKYAPTPDTLPRRNLFLLLRLMHRYDSVDDIMKDFSITSYETFTRELRAAMNFLYYKLDEVSLQCSYILSIKLRQIRWDDRLLDMFRTHPDDPLVYSGTLM
jgi:hypothetical protein